MQKLDALLNKNAKDHKFEAKIKTYKIYQLWERILLEFLPEAAGKTMITSYEKGCLQLAVLSNDLADQINICQQRIIYKLNSELGRKLVYRIQCQS